MQTEKIHELKGMDTGQIPNMTIQAKVYWTSQQLNSKHDFQYLCP